MRRSSCSRSILLIFLLFPAVLSRAYAGGAPSRDALLNIVTTCIDVHAPGYCRHCRWPRVESPCAKGLGCDKTTEVWKESARYVAVRDRKMCGCPPGFVHGLAIPRERITGVEDPKRPEGIWMFAWKAARKRISEESLIALAVNPRRLRTQDQLHVHILRLLPDARRRFGGARMTRVSSLGHVWSTAAAAAAAAHLKDYGVLVAKNVRGEGFIVLVVDGSPEKRYTRWKCGKQRQGSVGLGHYVTMYRNDPACGP